MIIYDPADFSLKNYRRLIKLAKKNYKFISYDKVMREKKFMLLRHDVDFSPQQALVLARIEKNMSVKATYFVMLSSLFYNVFEYKTKGIFLEILNMGHDLGLHFDPTVYAKHSLKGISEHIRFEANILEGLTNSKIRSVSFHHTTKEILSIGKVRISGLYNASSEFLQKNTKYCSDSNGYWRKDRLEDALKSTEPRLHVLIHPGWWMAGPLTPREKIQRAIDVRAKSCGRYHDYWVKKFGRKNVGK